MVSSNYNTYHSNSFIHLSINLSPKMTNKLGSANPNRIPKRKDKNVLALTRALWKTHYAIGKFVSIMLKRNLSTTEQIEINELKDKLAQYRKDLIPHGFDYMEEMARYSNEEYLQSGCDFPVFDERLPVTYEFVRELKGKVSILVNFESYIVKKDIHKFVLKIMNNPEIANKFTFDFKDVISDMEVNEELEQKVGKKNKIMGYTKMTDLFHNESTGKIRELRKILFIEVSKGVFKSRIWKMY